jgi:hypothetical protein
MPYSLRIEPMRARPALAGSGEQTFGVEPRRDLMIRIRPRQGA